jgi:hypothetical protein
VVLRAILLRQDLIPCFLPLLQQVVALAAVITAQFKAIIQHHKVEALAAALLFLLLTRMTGLAAAAAQALPAKVMVVEVPAFTAPETVSAITIQAVVAVVLVQLVALAPLMLPVMVAMALPLQSAAALLHTLEAAVGEVFLIVIHTLQMEPMAPVAAAR